MADEKGVGLKGWLSGPGRKTQIHQSETEKPVPLDRHRIAVLPFANISPDPKDEYFADGLTEELISTISNISEFSVISRTSALSYKGTSKKVKEIGQELEVGSVLEGSVRKAGDRMRITVQLINVGNDRHFWAQSYDRNLDDVFAIQTDIAKQVAEALKVRILPNETRQIEKSPTKNTEAYSLYLRGRRHWNNRGIDELKRAMKYFELAVSEDPDFALGYVGLADCCLMLRANWSLDPETNLENAEQNVAKALNLDPMLAEAHATKGLVNNDKFDLREAEKEYRKSIELKPSYASAHQWYSKVLVSQLRLKEAQEQIEKAVELDPLSPMIHHNHAALYLAKREYEKALEPARRAAELGAAAGHVLLAVAYGRMKKFDDMRREAAIFVELVQDSYPLVGKGIDAFIAQNVDDRKTLRSLLPFLETHLQESLTEAYLVACFYFYLGDNDKGFEWLERSFSRREGSLERVKFDWDLDRVRTDPRYLDLLKRMGLE